jgi:hypothetical protein
MIKDYGTEYKDGGYTAESDGWFISNIGPDISTTFSIYAYIDDIYITKISNGASADHSIMIPVKQSATLTLSSRHGTQTDIKNIYVKFVKC